MIKFGTGGWRAVIGDEFTKENIQILSRAMCDKMKAEGVADEYIDIDYYCGLYLANLILLYSRHGP